MSKSISLVNVKQKSLQFTNLKNTHGEVLVFTPKGSENATQECDYSALEDENIKKYMLMGWLALQPEVPAVVKEIVVKVDPPQSEPQPASSGMADTLAVAESFSIEVSPKKRKAKKLSSEE